MPDLVSGLSHLDADKKNDETLRAEALAHLSKRPELQLVAELLAKLRSLSLPWWTPEILRARWSAERRLEWLRQRPDLRQAITVKLTGLAPKAARSQKPQFQSAIIDAVLDEGDATLDAFEAAFDPADLVVYGSAVELWREFRERMPWEEDTAVHQDLVAWLLRALLTGASAVSGVKRTPILTPWDVRTRIDGRVWHTHVPLEIRVAIDEARFAREKGEPQRPFLAEDDLAIALPEIITENLPLRDLMDVLLAAEHAIGFDPSQPPSEPPPPSTTDPEKPAEAAAAQEAPKSSEPATKRRRPTLSPSSRPTSVDPAPSPKLGAMPSSPKLGAMPSSPKLGTVPPPPPRTPSVPPPAAAVVAAPPSVQIAPKDVIVSFADSATTDENGREAADPGAMDDDELARTNTWSVPSIDDMWTGEGEYDPSLDAAAELRAAGKSRGG